MLDLGKTLEWLKLSGKQAFILCVISSILLFGNNELIQKLGLLEARDLVKTWIGIVWLLFLAVLATEIIHPVYSWVALRIEWRVNLKKYQRRLHNLTPDEKEFLSGYLRENTRTQAGEYSGGTINGLVSEKIIYRSSNMAYHFTTFPYNIQPWAWEYLNSHPECLS